MARISSYDQDGTLNKLDKVIGTDSITGNTKNYTINSMLQLVNQEGLVEAFDGASFAFVDYIPASENPRGVINLNGGVATQANFSDINQLYISTVDKTGLSINEYLDNSLNNQIKVSLKGNMNQFGIYEVTAISSHDDGAYKILTLTPRAHNGILTVYDDFFLSNYSAVFDQDFSDDSITEFGDVSNDFFTGTGITELINAGSGQIITGVERTSLNNFTSNGLVHGDVVNNVTSTDIDVPLSAAQGKVLKDLIDAINTLLEVDTEDAPALDTLREIVNFCQTNASTLSSLGIGSINGLQDALDLKQNSESGKGLSANDFTTILKNKLDGIAENAQVNVNADWTAVSGDAQILSKPTDLTDLSIHYVVDLQDVNTAGSGDIITSDERTKLTNIDVNTTARTVTDGTDSITVPPQNAQQNVKANWDESDSASDAFIQNKPSLAPSNAEQNVQSDFSVTDTNSDAFIANKPSITVQGTTNEVEISPSGAQLLDQNRTFTIGLPNDVTIGEDLKVNETIELVNAQTSTPTFDNGIYYSTEDGHDTLHFRYHGHDLSIDYLTENIPTGILNGGELSTNTSTTFDIAAGDGIINILNKGTGTDPHPEIKKIEWSATTVTHTLGDANDADQLNTWIYVDQNGAIQQTLSELTPGIWRSNIVLGAVIHSSNTIRFVRTFPRTAYSSGNTYAEFVEIFGPLKKSGHLLTVNSTNNLALDRAAGQAFALGRNYVTDPLNPSLVSDGASTPVFHRYSSTASGFTKDNGVGGAGFTSIDPSKYDNNGTLTTVSGGNYSVQRLYHFPNNTNVIVAYYGKDEYASIDEAEKNYLLENFQEANNTATQAIFLGALIVKGNATDLSNDSQAKILTGGIFRSLSAANLGGVAANSSLSDLSDVTITSPTNGQVVKYNSTTGQFENQAEGGSIDGTGAANKLAIWSDTDTLTNDTDLHWDATNDRLGIGTTSPASPLHVNSGTGNRAATFTSSDPSVALALIDPNGFAQIQNTGGNLIFDADRDDERSNSYIGFEIDGGGEKMRIDSTGNVGIGTTSPDTKLHIESTSNTSSPILTIENDNAKQIELGVVRSIAGIEPDTSFLAYDNDFRFIAGAGSTNEVMRIDSNGKVGIGTDDPAVSLDLGNNSDALQLPVGDNTTRAAITNPFGGMIRYNTTDNQFEGYSGVGAAGSWGAIGGSSGGSGEIVKTTFSATGSASFSLPDTIVDIDNVNVYVSGVYQYPSNYTVSGNTVTFVSGSIPASGTDNVHIRHNVTATTLTEGAAFSTSGSLVGDDATTTFALGGSPRSSDHAMVFLEGVYQEKENYSIAGSNITFTTPPPNGYSIEVKYVTGVLDLTDVGQVVLDELTGDGTATYALSATPQSENYTNVYIEGVYQEKGTYSVSGSNITFSSNVPTGYSIEVSTMRTIPSSSVTQTTFVTDTFTANGSTNNFTLVNGSPSSKSLTMVFIQGVYQAKSNYNLVSGEIQFTEIPDEDDVIEVISMSAVNTAGSPVTSVNGEVGAVTVASKHNVSVISASTTAVANTLYVFTANLNLTLPASPAMGDSIKISNRSNVATCQLLRNGNNILGAAADLTLDTVSASFELVYTDTANGWVIIGQ